MVSGTPTLVPERRRWTLRGQLQGVGFRPFVYRLASELSLGGFVRNESSSVVIEAEGPAGSLDQFEAKLGKERPALAQVYAMISQPVPAKGGSAFAIEQSCEDAERAPVVTADTAVCPDCLRELFDPSDFRHHYPLINCTNCGPRYSIIRAMPYDRVNTTMQRFGLCEKCHQQYENPSDRRFHAQPVACGACGPKLGLFDFRLSVAEWDEPLAKAARLIERGRIVAIKGIGGFHLACRSDHAATVRKLRARKHRDSKPFALMVKNLEVARRLVELSVEAQKELAGPAAPIVLAPYRQGALPGGTLGLVAHKTHRLGVMLPYTPLHHLLFAEFEHGSGIDSLIMTSGNLGDEPLAHGDEEAFERLAGIADAVLFHQRPIERSVEDSVIMDMGMGERPMPIRRGRGYVPQSIFIQRSDVDLAAGTGLCVGGELKNTVALVRGDEVIVSHHLGDLKHALGYRHFRKAIEDLCSLHQVQPAWIAHDLHPTYLSTQWAGELSRRWSVPLIEVQHHHAHAAAVLAEHGVTGKALAIVCDGVGYGTDGTAWGGELLLVDMSAGRFERLGHLRSILLAGGDAAARETRRCAVGVMHALGRGIQGFFDETETAMVESMLASGTNCVSSTAAGRLFDAVAALLGVCQTNTHEAEAGMSLEALAFGQTIRAAAQPASVDTHDGLVIDLLPSIAELGARKQNGEDVARLSAEFHEQFCQAWAQAAALASTRLGINTVGLSGGVFCNQIVTQRLGELLRGRGMRVMRHEIVPPNDGGISFGQAAVALGRLAKRSEPCA